MKHLSALIALIFLLPLPSMAAPRHAGAQILASQLQLTVTAVAMVPTPTDTPVATPAATPATGASATSGSKSEELFVTVRVRYTGTDLLHFSPSEILLLDGSGQVHQPESYDGPDKLPSRDMMPPAPEMPAEVSGVLRYTVSTGATGNMAVLYVHKEQNAQGVYLPVVPYPSHAVTNPSAPDPLRLYATQAQPALRAYLLDEALAGGEVALDVDPLYAGGADAAASGTALARLARQGRMLAADRAGFDAVPVPARSSAAQGERSDADRAFRAVEGDLAAVGALRTYAQWARWHAQFAADNGALAGLYGAWPAVLPAQ